MAAFIDDRQSLLFGVDLVTLFLTTQRRTLMTEIVNTQIVLRLAAL
jgi:hypothetical protein